MDKEAIDRFRNRQRRLSQLDNMPCEISGKVSSEEVQAYFEDLPDLDWLASLRTSSESHYSVNLNLQVDEGVIESLLGDLHGKVTEREFDTLLASLKEQILNAVIKPFGLAKVLFDDKNGGNVTTIHNAQHGIYAKEEHRYDRTEYVNSKVQTKMDDYKKSRIDANQLIKDGFTGFQLEVSEAETDHILPLKVFHQNGGFMLGGERKVEFSSDPQNLAMTRRAVNRSKSAQELKSFEQNVVQGQDANNKARFHTDGRRTVPAAERGKLCAEKHGPTTDEKSSFYVSETMTTGASEALNMGLQQTLGLVLFELADAVMSEVRDIFRHWRKGALSTELLDGLKIRLKRVGVRLVDKWDEAFKAFIEGGISGFVSNLITFIINCFLTTVKKVVRIIREGALSLLRAFKLLLFPPEGMSVREAAHEATKVLVAGLAVVAGLGIEEFVSKSLSVFLPILAPLAEVVSSVLVGIVTGISAAILVYLLDKIDFFGVNQQRQHSLVMAELKVMSMGAAAEVEALMLVFDAPGTI